MKESMYQQGHLAANQEDLSGQPESAGMFLYFFNPLFMEPVDLSQLLDLRH